MVWIFAIFVPAKGIKEPPAGFQAWEECIGITADDLQTISGHRKTAIKTILLDQTCIAGIGNAYIHDILFLASVHPLRPANNLSIKERDNLIDGIHRGLEPSLAKGGAFYELNLFGQKGGFQIEDILVGYREGQPCRNIPLMS